MIAFVTLAALMLAAALAFVLPTLLHGRRAPADPATLAQRQLKALKQAHTTGVLSDAEYAAKRALVGEQMLAAIDASSSPARGTFFTALGIALLLPAAAIVLYRVVGEPRGVDATATATTTQAPADHTQNMEGAIANLIAKLKQNPDDIEGWTLLGRAYEATERFADARDSLKHAYDLAADDPDVTVAYAEALALASASRRIEGEPRSLLEKALKAAPDNQRGLWLIGISDYQAKQYDAAIATWKHLLIVLPKGSDVIQSVQGQIANAEGERDGRAPSAEVAIASSETAQAAAPATVPTPGDAAGPHLTVNVMLDPNLKGKLAPTDVLFVYAKAASGPPMPLAIARMQAAQLPATVTLTDGMGMLPNMKLSHYQQVIIGARVSKSGNAIAQSGDLQTLSKPLDVNSTAPVALTIDQVVP